MERHFTKEDIYSFYNDGEKSHVVSAVNFLNEGKHQSSFLKTQWKYPELTDSASQNKHFGSCVKHRKGLRLVTEALAQGIYGVLVKMVAGLFGASAVGQAGHWQHC